LRDCFVADSSLAYYLSLGDGYELLFCQQQQKSNQKNAAPNAALIPVATQPAIRNRPDKTSCFGWTVPAAWLTTGSRIRGSKNTTLTGLLTSFPLQSPRCWGGDSGAIAPDGRLSDFGRRDAP